MPLSERPLAKAIDRPKPREEKRTVELLSREGVRRKNLSFFYPALRLTPSRKLTA